jgi:hypothetical protein
MAMNKLLLPILAIGIIALAGVAGMVYWRWVNAPEKPPTGSGRYFGIMLRLENSTGGDWNITVTGGSQPLTNVRMTVTNETTGVKTVDRKITDLVPEKNDPDAVFNDSNANKKIDAGDSIVLKWSSPNIRPGYNVDFIVGDNLLGVIRHLP